MSLILNKDKLNNYKKFNVQFDNNISNSLKILKDYISIEIGANFDDYDNEGINPDNLSIFKPENLKLLINLFSNLYFTNITLRGMCITSYKELYNDIVSINYPIFYDNPEIDCYLKYKDDIEKYYEDINKDILEKVSENKFEYELDNNGYKIKFLDNIYFENFIFEYSSLKLNSIGTYTFKINNLFYFINYIFFNILQFNYIFDQFIEKLQSLSELSFWFNSFKVLKTDLLFVNDFKFNNYIIKNIKQESCVDLHIRHKKSNENILISECIKLSINNILDTINIWNVFYNRHKFIKDYFQEIINEKIDLNNYYGGDKLYILFQIHKYKIKSYIKQKYKIEFGNKDSVKFDRYFFVYMLFDICVFLSKTLNLKDYNVFSSIKDAEIYFKQIN
ncbi:MAG: hypothetical protein KatS3mg068_1562 [Candidatus Sericytochromatia bacterium]|nr:MAG: hypothetical protein KatS3mg068_1562 [Candidatus Sericytochromatia bacterium]